MDTITNTRDLRENLSYFFDKAVDAPISINRGDDRYILISEAEFLSLKEEVMILKKSLISSLQIQSGKGSEIDDIESEDSELIDEVSKNKLNSKKK